MADYKILLDRAARLCSRSEKCEHELREKLISWGLDSTNTEKAIAYLVENNFIDDERYTQFFVRDKLKFNKWGRIKIIYALRQKRIVNSIIENAIEKIDKDQYQNILDELLRSKIKSVSEPTKPENKAKLIRFAAQRGFTSEEIYSSLNRILKD